MLDLSLGDSEACARRLEPLLDASERAHVVDPGVNRYVPDLTEALIDLGRLDAADALLTTLEGRAQRLERPSVQAAARRCRALLLAHRGDLDPAIALLEEALELHARAPIPFERARTLLALGIVQRRARRRKASRESLASALGIFDDLGAALWAAKARTELGRIGGRAPSADGLTPTEERVAALVVEGKSNKEVASDLVLSVHTVEAALTSIYRKLDVRSRTELARKVAESDGDH
jgi:DNA-binding NarL/FixJ family response regulator